MAVDGRRILANPSRHAALSHARAAGQLRQVERETEQLPAKAEPAAATPRWEELTIEGELARRQERKAQLVRARAAQRQLYLKMAQPFC